MPSAKIVAYVERPVGQGWKAFGEDLLRVRASYTHLIFWGLRNQIAQEVGLKELVDNGYVEKLQDMGVKVMITSNYNRFYKPSDSGQRIAEFAKRLNLDGIDYPTWNMNLNQKWMDWMVQAAISAKEAFPNAIISHSPSSSSLVGEFNYLDLFKKAKGAIDFLNIKYYNSENHTYTDFESLFVSNNGTSVGELIKRGLKPENIVVGKQIWAEKDPDYMDPSTLAGYLKRSATLNVAPGGVMGVNLDCDLSEHDGKWSDIVSAGFKPNGANTMTPGEKKWRLESREVNIGKKDVA